jgi:hypothetical protein
MKEYLQEFRNQAFEGSIKLFRRILIPYFVLNVIIAVISLTVLVPLLLKAFGWELADFLSLSEKMQEASQVARNGGDPMEIFTNIFGSIQPLFIILYIITGILVHCWLINAFFTLNDNEVRHGSRSFAKALAASFNGRILNIFGYLLAYCLFTFVLVLVFIFLIVMLVSISKIIGVILGFIGFFAIIIYLFRFSLGLPALVHGHMNFGDAIAFSYRHITWKRAGLIFLVFLILFILFAILSYILNLMVFAVLGKEGNSPGMMLVVQQVLSAITGGILGAFIYAAMSALYFRYSSDEETEQEAKDHLVI